MLKVERLLQILVLLMVSLSGLLLGVGQRDYGLSMLAIGTAFAAFVFNDVFGWLRFNRWLANVAAIAITAYSLRNFFSSQSTDQLVMIADLLVYLQIVLLFQKKTPRVFWQVMVLSLLQVVVAAAFNIGFEGGVLFFAYMLLCGTTMMILHLHGETFDIAENNRQTIESAMKSGTVTVSSNSGAAAGATLRIPHSSRILAVFDQVCHRRGTVRQMLRQIFSTGIVAIGFASVAFYFLPRDETVWTGSQIGRVEPLGASKQIDLNQTTQIVLSQISVMKMQLTDSTGTNIKLNGQPYIRGMPLPNLTIENDQTTWKAPYDRIYTNDRFILQEMPPSSGFVIQKFEHPPATDPLVHGIAPSFRVRRGLGSSDIQYSQVLDALTRTTDASIVDETKTTYELTTPLLTGNQQLLAYPYLGIRPRGATIPMESNRGEHDWLTMIDRTRYPTLVREAQLVVDNMRLRGQNHRRIAQELNDHLISGKYEYTLDFHKINWEPGVDHVEDFIANKKKGHCEFFASALTLMLRSQGIPARLVVGYLGGVYDETGEFYDVQQRHAHAWVEAYIRAKDCPVRWLRTGQADARGGAWMRLDPTPPGDDENANALRSSGAYDYAKDFWDNYVMGLDKEKQKDSMLESFMKNPMRAVSNIVSPAYWSMQISKIRESNSWWSSPVVVWGIVALFLIVVALIFWYQHNKTVAIEKINNTHKRTPLIQRVLGKAIAIVAPKFGRWVAGETEPSRQMVEFYQRFLRLMQKKGLQRNSTQTHQEFAQSAASHFSAEPDSKVTLSIRNLTEWFYRVRFGDTTLDKSQLEDIENTLLGLESELSNSPATV